MDYVVAGFGVGAILALVGFALWELFGNVEEPGRGWLSRAAIGLMLGALVIWSVTGVTLVSTIDDSTGSRLVFFTSLVTLVAVAAGTLWYWHADQAIAASAGPRTRQRIEQPASVAAAPDDVELSEWDTWPERVERSSQEAAVVAVAAADDAHFEPEVAAEAIEAPQEAPQAEEQPVADPAPVEDVVDVRAAVDAVPETEGSSADEAPSNVVPFRLPATVESAPESDADNLDADIDEQDEAVFVEDVVIEESDEPASDDSSKNGSLATNAFESSLLADIDAGSVGEDGRYRSSILADLVPDPNELEGVGLAKWRPDARLDAEDAEPPRKSRKK